MSEGPITIASADTYEPQLHAEGKVIASFAERRRLIYEQLQYRAQTLNATLGDSPEDAALLDEDTALVEHPTVYTGEFEPGYLDVPPECLILTMRLYPKYFTSETHTDELQ